MKKNENLVLENEENNISQEYGYSTFKMYSNEKEILKIVKSILRKYGNSNREKYEKEDELFHLLCFLDKDNKLTLYKKIRANEPGDLIIDNDGETTLVEVVMCFGNDESYYYFQKRMNKLFNRTIKLNKKFDEKKYGYSINDGIEQFLKVFKIKCDKDYVKKREYNHIELLVVTAEYECCFPNWLTRFIKRELIENNPFDKIMILDYFSCGRDGNPTIIRDYLEEIET